MYTYIRPNCKILVQLQYLPSFQFYMIIAKQYTKKLVLKLFYLQYFLRKIMYHLAYLACNGKCTVSQFQMLILQGYSPVLYKCMNLRWQIFSSFTGMQILGTTEFRYIYFLTISCPLRYESKLLYTKQNIHDDQ